MSKNNEQTKLAEIKSEKDKIFDWLKSNGFNIDGDKAIRETPGPVKRVIINGQQITQQESPQTIVIECVGEGSISNSESSIPIYGFDISMNGQEVGPTEYVDSLEQFMTSFE